MEQPGKEAELLWHSILTSAELGQSQTPERNFWNLISFSWGELLHRNTTRTSSCKALGQPQKRKAISQQPNLFPKPGKHLEREKNVVLPITPSIGDYSRIHGDEQSAEFSSQ